MKSSHLATVGEALLTIFGLALPNSNWHMFKWTLEKLNVHQLVFCHLLKEKIKYNLKQFNPKMHLDKVCTSIEEGLICDRANTNHILCNLSPWNGSKHWTPLPLPCMRTHFFSWNLVADKNIVQEARKSSKVSLRQGRPAKNTKVELYFYFSCYSTDLLFGYQITGWVWFSHTFAFHMLNRKSNNRLLLLLVGFRYSSS